MLGRSPMPLPRLLLCTEVRSHIGTALAARRAAIHDQRVGPAASPAMPADDTRHSIVRRERIKQRRTRISITPLTAADTYLVGLNSMTRPFERSSSNVLP
jgi:hypothetical protein